MMTRSNVGGQHGNAESSPGYGVSSGTRGVWLLRHLHMLDLLITSGALSELLLGDFWSSRALLVLVGFQIEASFGALTDKIPLGRGPIHLGACVRVCCRGRRRWGPGAVAGGVNHVVSLTCGLGKTDKRCHSQGFHFTF